MHGNTVLWNLTNFIHGSPTDINLYSLPCNIPHIFKSQEMYWILENASVINAILIFCNKSLCCLLWLSDLYQFWQIINFIIFFRVKCDKNILEHSVSKISLTRLEHEISSIVGSKPYRDSPYEDIDANSGHQEHAAAILSRTRFITGMCATS